MYLTSTNPKEHPMIFVFGSNRQGRHGKGAALHARTHYGARYGQASGLQGNSYAIITKELRRSHAPVTLAEVAQGVSEFIEFVRSHPDLEFQVTPIGCGLAGFSPYQIAPLFAPLENDQNVHLPPQFISVFQ